MFHPSSSSQPAEVFRKDLISAMKLPDSHQLLPDNYWVIQDQWKQEWEKGVQVPVDDTSINDPQFFEVRMKDCGTFELPDEFIKCYSGSEEQMRQAEERQKQIEATCQYDLDEVDIQWLHIINREREDMGESPIDELTMEKIIEQCEIQCQKNIEHAIQTEEGLGIEYDEDICCAVCRAPDSEEGNEMVFCDKCDICVHQACYGVLKIPEGSWMCRVCALGLTPECMLCGKKGGAMKSTRSGTKWAHVNCALWIPEVSIGDVDRMEPITKIAQIPASRWSLICNLCRERTGACIQCSVKTCKIAYHVTCAVENGLEMEQNLDENKEVKFKSFCLKHTNSRKSNSSSSDAPPKHVKCKKSSEEERANARAMRIQRVTEEFQKYVRKKEVVSRFKDDAAVVDLVFEYWKLKRKSGFNKPLLNFPHEDDKDKNSEEYNLHARMKMFVHLRQDLERVRNLCYMVQKREKLSRQMMRLREGLFKKQCEFFNGNLTRMTEEEVDWAARAGEISARVPYPMSEDVILNKWLSIPSDGPKMLFDDDEDDTTEEDSEMEMEAKKERDKKKREKAAARRKKEAEATARLKEKLAQVKGPVSSNTRGVKHRRVSSMDGKEIYEDEIRSRKGGTPNSRLSDSSRSPSCEKELVNGEASREVTPERSSEKPKKPTIANKKRDVEPPEKDCSKHVKENKNNLKKAKEKSSHKEHSFAREKSSERGDRKSDVKSNKLKEKQITRDNPQHHGERKGDPEKEKLNSVHNHRMNHKAPIKRKNIANNNRERDLKHSINKKDKKFFKSPNSKQKRTSNSDENSINNHIIKQDDKVHFLGQGLEVKGEWTYWQTSEQRKVQSEKEVRHDEDKNAAEFLLLELGDKAQLPLTPFDNANAKPESQDFIQRHSEDQNAADFLSFEKLDGKTSTKDLQNESTPLNDGTGKRYRAADRSQDSFGEKLPDLHGKNMPGPANSKLGKKHTSGTGLARGDDSSSQKSQKTQEQKKAKSKSSQNDKDSGKRKERDRPSKKKNKDVPHRGSNHSDTKEKTRPLERSESEHQKERTLSSHDRQNSHSSKASVHDSVHHENEARDAHGKKESGKDKGKHRLKFPDHCADKVNRNKREGKQDRKTGKDLHGNREKFKSPKDVDHNRSTETNSGKHSGQRASADYTEERAETKRAPVKSRMKSPPGRRSSVEEVSEHGRDRLGSSGKRAHDKNRQKSPSARRQSGEGVSDHGKDKTRLTKSHSEGQPSKSKPSRERSRDKNTMKSPSGHKPNSEMATNHEKDKRRLDPLSESGHRGRDVKPSETGGNNSLKDRSRMKSPLGRRTSTEGSHTGERERERGSQKAEDGRRGNEQERAKGDIANKRRETKLDSTEPPSPPSDSSRDRVVGGRRGSSSKRDNSVETGAKGSERLPILPSKDRGRSLSRTCLSSSREPSMEGSVEGRKERTPLSSPTSSDVQNHMRRRDSRGASPSGRGNSLKEQRSWNHSTDTADDSSSVENEASVFDAQDTDITQSDKDTDPPASIFDLAPDEKPFQGGYRHSSRRVSSASSDHGSQADAELSDDTDIVRPPRTKRRRKSAASMRNDSLARHSRKSSSLLSLTARRRGSLSSDRSSVVSLDELVEREPRQFNKSLDRPPTPTLAREVPAGRDEGKYSQEREKECRKQADAEEVLITRDGASKDQKTSQISEPTIDVKEGIQRNEFEGQSRHGGQLKEVAKEKQRSKSGGERHAWRNSMTTRTRSVAKDIGDSAVSNDTSSALQSASQGLCQNGPTDGFDRVNRPLDTPLGATESESTITPPKNACSNEHLPSTSNPRNGEVGCFDRPDLNVTSVLSDPQQREPSARTQRAFEKGMHSLDGNSGGSSQHLPKEVAQSSQREVAVSAQEYPDQASAKNIPSEPSHLGSQDTFNGNLESLPSGNGLAAGQPPKQPPVLHHSGIPMSLGEPGAAKVIQPEPTPLSEDMPGIRLDELWAKQKTALERIAEMVPEALSNLDLLPPVLEPSVPQSEADVSSLFSLNQDIGDPKFPMTFSQIPPDVQGVLDISNHPLDGKEHCENQRKDGQIPAFPEWKERPDALIQTLHSSAENTQSMSVFEAEFADVPVTAKSSETGLYGLNASLNRTLFSEVNDEKTEGPCIEEIIKNHLPAPHEVQGDLFTEKHPLTLPPPTQQQPEKLIHWGLNEPSEITGCKNITARRKSAPGMVPKQPPDPISLQRTLRRNNSMLTFPPPPNQVNYPVNNMAMFSSLVPKGTQGSLWDMTPKDARLPSHAVEMWEPPPTKESRAPQGNGWDLPPLLRNKQCLESLSLTDKSGTTAHSTQGPFGGKSTDTTSFSRAKPTPHKSGGSWRDILDNMPKEREEFGWNPVDLPEFVPPPPPNLVPAFSQFNSFVGESSGFHSNLSDNVQKEKTAIHEEVQAEDEPPSSKSISQNELKVNATQSTQSEKVPETVTAPKAATEKEPEKVQVTGEKPTNAPENGIYFHKKLSSQRRREVRCNPLSEPKEPPGKTTTDPSSQDSNASLSQAKLPDVVTEARAVTEVGKPASKRDTTARSKNKPSTATKKTPPEESIEKDTDNAAKNEGLRTSRRLRERKKASEDSGDTQSKTDKEAEKVDENRNITTRRGRSAASKDTSKACMEAKPGRAANLKTDEDSTTGISTRRKSAGDKGALKTGQEAKAGGSEKLKTGEDDTPLGRMTRRRMSTGDKNALKANQALNTCESEVTNREDPIGQSTIRKAADRETNMEADKSQKDTQLMGTAAGDKDGETVKLEEVVEPKTEDLLGQLTLERTTVREEDALKTGREVEAVKPERAAMMQSEEGAPTLEKMTLAPSTPCDRNKVKGTISVAERKAEAKVGSPSKVLHTRRNKFNSSISVLSSRREDPNSKVSAKRQLLAKEFTKHIRGTPIKHSKDTRKRTSPPAKKRPQSAPRRPKRPKTEKTETIDIKVRGGVFDFTSDEDAEDSVPIILPISPRVLLTDVSKKQDIKEVPVGKDTNNGTPSEKPLDDPVAVDVKAAVDGTGIESDSKLPRDGSTSEVTEKKSLSIIGLTDSKQKSTMVESVIEEDGNKPVNPSPLTFPRSRVKQRREKSLSAEGEETNGDRRRSSRVLAKEKEEAAAKAKAEEEEPKGPLNERKASLRIRKKDVQQTNHDSEGEDDQNEETATLLEIRMESAARGKEEGSVHKRVPDKDDKAIPQKPLDFPVTMTVNDPIGSAADIEFADREEEPLAKLKEKLITHGVGVPGIKSVEEKKEIVEDLIAETATKSSPEDEIQEAAGNSLVPSSEELGAERKCVLPTDLKIEGANGKLVIKNWKQFSALRKKKKKKKKKLALKDGYRTVCVSESQGGLMNGLRLKITTIDRYFKPVPTATIPPTDTPDETHLELPTEEKSKAHTPIKLRISKSLLTPYKSPKEKVRNHDEDLQSKTDSSSTDPTVAAKTLDEGAPDEKVVDTKTLDETTLERTTLDDSARVEGSLVEKPLEGEGSVKPLVGTLDDDDDDKPLVVMKSQNHQPEVKQPTANEEEKVDGNKVPVEEKMDKTGEEKLVTTKPDEIPPALDNMSAEKISEPNLLPPTAVKNMSGLKTGPTHNVDGGAPYPSASKQEDRNEPRAAIPEKRTPLTKISNEKLMLGELERKQMGQSKEPKCGTVQKKPASMDVFDFEDDLEDEPPKVFPSPTMRSKVRRSLDTSTSSVVVSSPFEGPSPLTVNVQGKRERRLVNYFEGSDNSDDGGGGEKQQPHKKRKVSLDAPAQNGAPQGSDKLEFLESMGT